MSQGSYQNYVAEQQQKAYMDPSGNTEILSYDQWLQTQPQQAPAQQTAPTQQTAPQPQPAMTQTEYNAVVAAKETEFNALPLATKQSELQRLMPSALDVVPKGATITNITFSGGQLNFSYTSPPTPRPTTTVSPSGGSDNLTMAYNPLAPSETQQATAPVPTQFNSMPGGYWNPTGYTASKDLMAQVPAGATNVEIIEQRFVGPPAPGTTVEDYPTGMKIAYTPPPAPIAVQKEAAPPPNLSQGLLNIGASMPTTYGLVNPIGGKVRDVLGLDPAPNLSSFSAGVVASGEALAYSAPRTFVQTGTALIGGALGKSQEADLANQAAQFGMNKVIPQPPATVSGGAVQTVLGGGTGQLEQAIKNPAYAAGTLAGDIAISLLMGKAATRISGGNLTQDLTRDLQQPIKESRFGQNFQDKLNMDYRVAQELGKTYKPGFTDKVVSKVTGITAKEPATGTTFLPTVETVPKEGWETRVTIRASDTEFHMEPRIYEKEPIDSIANMMKGNPSKMQAGMDLMDFADAPNSQIFGLSVEPMPPVDKAALTARQVSTQTPLPLKFGLGEGYLINAPGTETFRTTYERQQLNAELNQKYGVPSSEPLGFNKTPYDMGTQSQFMFQKQSLPTAQKLMPVTQPAYSPTVSNSQFYRLRPWPVMTYQTPIATTVQQQETTSGQKAETSTIATTITRPSSFQQYPTQQQRATEEQSAIYSYPSSSPLKTPTSPIQDAGLNSFPVDLSRATSSVADRITPIVPVGLGETGIAYDLPTTPSQPPIGITTNFPIIGILKPKPPIIGSGIGSYPITDLGSTQTPVIGGYPIEITKQPQQTIFNIPAPARSKDYTPTQTYTPPYTPSYTPKNWYPSGNLGGWGGPTGHERPFLFGGIKKRRKEYPIVGASEVLRSFI